MNQLYPIIRRARRSLWPEGDVTPATPSVTPVPEEVQESTVPATEAPVAPVIVEAAPVAAPTVVESPSFALATEAAPVQPKPKRVRRRGNAPE